MRLIDADKLIEFIDTFLLKTCKRDGTTIPNRWYGALKRCVEEQPTIEKGEWIPVSSGKLPENNEEVWITDMEGKVERSRFYKELYTEDGEKDTFACRTYLVYAENVLAWQSTLKPEPYKAESENKE